MPARAADDAATRALAELAEVLERTGAELVSLGARCRELAEWRRGGPPWREIVPDEVRPLVVERMTEILDRLADSGAAFRRAQARALIDEGLTRREVAELYGVTPQRVGALLKPPPAEGARAVRRPHPVTPPS